MSESRPTVPLSTLMRRTLWTVVAPQRVFRQLSDQESVSLPQLFLAAVLLCGSESFLRASVWHRRWIFQLLPTDWVPSTLGWTLFNLNAWMLVVLVLLMLNQQFRGPRRTAAPFWMMGFHILGAFWIISLSIDMVHLVLKIPPVQLQIDTWPWLSGPLVGLWLHAALWIEAPWSMWVLYMAFRHFLRWDTRGRMMLGAVLAVVLPVGGRLLIEPLPNVAIRILYRWWPVARVDGMGGWITLATHAAAAIVVGMAVRRWLRQLPLMSDHP